MPRSRSLKPHTNALRELLIVTVVSMRKKLSDCILGVIQAKNDHKKLDFGNVTKNKHTSE